MFIMRSQFDAAIHFPSVPQCLVREILTKVLISMQAQKKKAFVFLFAHRKIDGLAFKILLPLHRLYSLSVHTFEP